MAEHLPKIEGLSLALGAACAALIVAAPGPYALVLAGAATLLLMICIVWADGASFTIPDGSVAALAMIGVALRLASDGVSAAGALDLGADVALTGGLLWGVREIFFRLNGHDGLGLGDVKLAAAAGCLVGASGFAFALLAASLAGLAIAAIRGLGAGRRIAFGTLLAPAIWAVWVASPFV